jgi:hypothetical protein
MQIPGPLDLYLLKNLTLVMKQIVEVATKYYFPGQLVVLLTSKMIPNWARTQMDLPFACWICSDLFTKRCTTQIVDYSEIHFDSWV